MTKGPCYDKPSLVTMHNASRSCVLRLHCSVTMQSEFIVVEESGFAESWQALQPLLSLSLPPPPPFNPSSQQRGWGIFVLSKAPHQPQHG